MQLLGAVVKIGSAEAIVTVARMGYLLLLARLSHLLHHRWIRGALARLLDQLVYVFLAPGGLLAARLLVQQAFLIHI